LILKQKKEWLHRWLVLAFLKLEPSEMASAVRARNKASRIADGSSNVMRSYPWFAVTQNKEHELEQGLSHESVALFLQGVAGMGISTN